MQTVPLAPYHDDRGNRILIDGPPHESRDSSVQFRGTNCVLHIGRGARLDRTAFAFDADGGKIEVGDNFRFNGIVRVGLRSTIRIGRNVSLERDGYLCAQECTTLTIGDDCMFALRVDIRTDDAHAIFDLATGLRINRSRDVTIADHVWLARDVTVGKGSVIGPGSVVGHRSFVHGKLPANCLAVGTPARVVRKQIGWSRVHLGLHAPYKFDSVRDLPPSHAVPPAPRAQRPPSMIRRAARRLKRLLTTIRQQQGRRASPPSP